MVTVYKYRSFTTDDDESRLIDWLQGRIWFAPATDVNDPFEFRCVTDFFADFEATVRLFAFIEQLTNPSTNSADALTKSRRVLTNVPRSKLRERQWEAAYSIWKSLASSLAMCCFAGVPDEILMWAHYAARHTGVCLEFEHAALDSIARPVVYDARIVTLNPVDIMSEAQLPLGSQSEIANRLFLTKATCWSHEREHRVLLPIEMRGLRQLPHGAVRRIVVGCALPPSQLRRLRVLIAAHAPHVRIALAVPSPGSYTLEVANIDELE